MKFSCIFGCGIHMTTARVTLLIVFNGNMYRSSYCELQQVIYLAWILNPCVVKEISDMYSP